MVGDATSTTTPRLMFDILGGPWPYIGAVLSMIVLLGGAVAFSMYIYKWVRDYRDETKHVGDTQ